MLSYLKDANQVPAAAQINAQAQDQSTPLSGPDDYLTVAGHGKKLRQSTMLLCGLFVIGAAVVLFMIKKTTPVVANAAPNQDQLQIEAALAKFEQMKKETDRQMNSVVGRFYQYSNVNQIGVSELKKNPFRLEVDFVPAKEGDGAGVVAQQKERLLAEAQYQSGQLELWSVTSTPQGMCCMIGDKVLYEGDTIGEMKVVSIFPKRVVLNYKGVPVELTIE